MSHQEPCNHIDGVPRYACDWCGYEDFKEPLDDWSAFGEASQHLCLFCANLASSKQSAFLPATKKDLAVGLNVLLEILEETRV